MGVVADGLPPDDTGPCAVKILDMISTIASVRTDARWDVDYIHLAKMSGEWKIINVLWDRPVP